MAATETYVNPRSCLAIAIILPVLSVLTVTARLISRQRNRISLGPDDYFSLGSTIILIGCSICIIIGVANKSVGYHSVRADGDFHFSNVQTIEKLQFAYDRLWYVGVTCVKLSWLFCYRRLFHGTTFKVVNYTTMALTVLWGILFVLLGIFQCGIHFSDSWSNSPAFLNPQCFDTIIFLFANALTSCFLDVLIFLIPLPLIWQLNMNPRTKVALLGLFAIGGFGVAASAVRLTLYASIWWAVTENHGSASIMGLTGNDDLGLLSMCFFWSQIELGVTNIASCLPAIKAVFTATQWFHTLSSKVPAPEETTDEAWTRSDRAEDIKMDNIGLQITRLSDQPSSLEAPNMLKAGA